MFSTLGHGCNHQSLTHLLTRMGMAVAKTRRLATRGIGELIIAEVSLGFRV